MIMQLEVEVKVEVELDLDGLGFGTWGLWDFGLRLLADLAVALSIRNRMQVQRCF